MRIAAEILSVLLMMAASAGARAQNGYLHGRVTDSEGYPMELAVVVVDGSLWATSDKDGKWNISRIKPGEHTWVASYTGYAESKGKITVAEGGTRLDIVLKELSLQLETVTVTADREDLGSKSTIGQEAIRHIQPKSISDLFQLLPGNLTTNSNLNALSQASVREIDEGNYANAMGTSVVVDGSPLGNDASLQALSPSRSGTDSSTNSDGMSDQTTAGRGVDLRTVSAGNVESVEVISGIPSVEYGNLTSGVVIVRTKSGQTPWEIKASADPVSKLAYIGKGFALKKGGAVNFGADWSQSWSDPRRKYMGYDRLTASGGWSGAFGPLTMHVKGSFFHNINNRKTDPQFLEDHILYTNRNTGGRLSVNGRANFKDGFLTAIDYNMSLSASRTHDWHRSLISSPPGVITDARTSGVREAIIKRQAYYSEYEIEGIPIDFFAQAVANRHIHLKGNAFTTLRFGAEYKMSANKGKGVSFDILNPPSTSGSKTLRPRAYKDIPAIQYLSVFASDKMSLDIAGNTFKSEAGIRGTWMPIDKQLSGGNGGYLTAEPRINMSWTILKGGFLDELSLTGGYGISNKMPTLLYLYPDPLYIDIGSLNYGGSDGYFSLITTQVIDDTMNPSLRPSTSHKAEAGFSFKKGKAKGYATFFRERHLRELGFESGLVWTSYDLYTLPQGASSPSFDPVSRDVTYTAGGVSGSAERSAQVLMSTWNKPGNTSRSDKWGIEYGLDLGTWKALRTSLNMNGAWFHIRRISDKQGLNYVQSNYDHVGVMPAGSGSVRDRINTTFRLVTHIPEVRMVFTTTLQVVWYESRQSIWEDADGNPVYTLFSAGGTDYLAVDPIGFWSKDGSYTPWQDSFRNDASMQRMMQRYYLVSFKKDVTEPWAMLNIRFTKEIGKVAELSFTANNVTNSSRYHVGKYIYTRTQLYPDIYFGAELKIKL